MNRRTKKNLVAVVGAFVASIGALNACSLIVDTRERTCTVDSECAPFAPGAVCAAAGTCSLPGDGSAAAKDGTTVSGACTTNSECLAKSGEPSICQKAVGRCVRLTTPDCPIVFGVSTSGDLLTDRRAVESDDTIVLGSLTSLAGANQAKGEARVSGIQLALSEFSTRGGVPFGDRNRPVAFVSCNDVDVSPPDAGVDKAVVRAARHLVDDIGVPAIIGAGTSSTTTDAIRAACTKGTLLIAPSATSPALTTNADKSGLFLRTAPSDALQAIPLAQLAADAEAALPAGTHRLMLLTKNDSYGQGLRDQIIDKLQFNGKKLSDPANATATKLFEFSADPTFDFTPLVNATASLLPQVVVLAGTNEAVDGIVAKVEAVWPGGTPRPVYIASDGLKADKLLTLVKADDSSGTPTGLRTRVRGTAPGRPTATTQTFALRYGSRFPAAPGGSSTFGTAGAYDAAYLLFYGLAASGVEPITGRTILDGISGTVVVDGRTPIEVGPTGIDTAKPLLRSKSPFKLVGASSPLDFDAAGESPSDIEVWCVRPGGTFFSTERYYSATSRTVVGAFNCPN
jgi:ABC-type branched-subunit amino acid transport system substrate-binding protein